jgi:hypothetical protein
VPQTIGLRLAIPSTHRSFTTARKIGAKTIHALGRNTVYGTGFLAFPRASMRFVASPDEPGRKLSAAVSSN